MPSKVYFKRLLKTYKRNETEMLTEENRKATKDGGRNGKRAPKLENMHSDGAVRLRRKYIPRNRMTTK